ncbi:MAG: hypothetical protein AAGF81_03405 [Pseudomonadota bacterium]
MSRDGQRENGSGQMNDLREILRSLEQAHSRAEKINLKFLSYLIDMAMIEVRTLLNAAKNG